MLIVGEGIVGVTAEGVFANTNRIEPMPPPPNFDKASLKTIQLPIALSTPPPVPVAGGPSQVAAGGSAAHRGSSDREKIFVGGLTPSTTLEMLKDYFQRHVGKRQGVRSGGLCRKSTVGSHCSRARSVAGERKWAFWVAVCRRDVALHWRSTPRALHSHCVRSTLASYGCCGSILQVPVQYRVPARSGQQYIVKSQKICRWLAFSSVSWRVRSCVIPGRVVSRRISVCVCVRVEAKVQAGASAQSWLLVHVCHGERGV